jgi:hypothetical protein
MALFRLHLEPEARIREDFDREAWPHFREIYRAAIASARTRSGLRLLFTDSLLEALVPSEELLLVTSFLFRDALKNLLQGRIVTVFLGLLVPHLGSSLGFDCHFEDQEELPLSLRKR